MIARLLPLALCLPCAAQDVWVDPVGGSNANGGTSANDAFATITFALQVLGPITDGVPDRVNLLAGVYRSANGEVWPLAVREEVELFGVEGASQTVLRGPGSGTATLIEVPEATLPIAQTRITGVTLRTAQTAITSTRVNLAVTDCLVRDCGTGVELTLSGSLLLSSMRADRTTFRDCGTGVRIDGRFFFQSDCTLVDCALRDCGVGLWISHFGDSFFRGNVVRSSFERCTTGIRASNGAFDPQQLLDIVSTLIADGDVGVDATAGTVTITGCTITGNSTAGVVFDPGFQPVSGGMDGSIVWGNLVDVSGGPWTADFCDIGAASVPSGTGNVSVDPGFRAPANGDYRIAFGTPCVDGGSTTEADLVGTLRSIDGDLDLGGAPDMGALELLPLDGPQTVQPGDALELELHGYAGEYAWLRLSRAGLLATPVATSFGDLWLDLNLVEDIALVRTNGGAPDVVVIQIPNNPALIGLTVGLQSLVRSPLSPSGAAYSPPLAVTIIP